MKDRIRLAVKELERGRPAAAKRALDQALAVEPGHAEALAYLGTTLLHLGDNTAAIAPLERATRTLGNQGWIVGNLAEAYFRAGRPADAQRSFLDASRLDPGNLNFRLGAANCMALQGRYDEAAGALEDLLRQQPGHPLLWYNLGNVRRDQQRAADAIRCFELALASEPDWVDARNSLGSALHHAFRFEDAEREYRRCIDQAPDRIEFHVNLISVLIDKGSPSQAEAVGREVVARWPESSLARGMLSAALTQQGKLAQALEHDRAAVALDPDDAQHVASCASTLSHLGQSDAAWPLFERALSLQPGSSRIHQLRFDALLARGRLAEAWADYTHRVTDVEFAVRFPGHARALEFPGGRAPGAGSAVTLVGEQGLGDELFFLRFARLLAAEGASVSYLPSGKLRRLLRGAEPVATMLEADRLDPASPVMLVGDLPHALIRAGLLADDAGSAHAFPAPLQLRPDDDRLGAMRERLAASGPPPYVAVTWFGGVPPRDQKREWTLHKTVDPDGLGLALRPVPGTLISVQRIPEAADAARLARAAGRTVHDYSDLNDALEDMLALLDLVDEYVGVSNTNMHMRAGLGKPARVLVPAPAEWRWAGDGPRSAWFPGFVCYRQSLEGEWAPALRALERDLLAALTNR